MKESRAGSLLSDFFTGKGDIVLPVIISLAIHGFLIYYIFSGGAQVSGQNSKLYAGKKLTMAEDFVAGQSNLLLARLSDRLSRVRGSTTERDETEWTLDNTPDKMTFALKRGDVRIADVRVAKVEEEGQEERYDIVLKIYTSPEMVFDDILLASYLVGEGTMHGRFKTESLLIYVKDENSPGAALFSTNTLQTRRFYLSRISPQEFFLDAIAREVKDW